MVSASRCELRWRTVRKSKAGKRIETFTGRTLPSSELLKYRVPAAAAMVGGLRISPPVVVIEHQVLAFEANKVGHAAQVAFVLGYDERGRLVRYDHPCYVDITAFVIFGPSILGRTDGDVGRVIAIGVLLAVRTADVDRI